jgi:hypothetical protein
MLDAKLQELELIKSTGTSGMETKEKHTHNTYIPHIHKTTPTKQ